MSSKGGGMQSQQLAFFAVLSSPRPRKYRDWNMWVVIQI